MKTHARKPRTSPPVPIKPRTAVPIRFDESDNVIIDTLAERTHLSKADIVRRALRFAGPRFISGKVNIADLTEVAA